ncbi:hypothetical protein [Flavobacterium sp. GP15]|uniref:hypothetical protein n=1 Tax=Flavobacterium sp. GP15 TaxID=2758567 RepID=UPI00165E58F3|nr:hypothetical protein [Flavobacterium sp. GP15]
MKKFLFLVIITLTIISCKENNRSNLITNSNKINFKDLDSIKQKQKNEIELYLKKCNYEFLSDQSAGFQWKSKHSEDVIQFSGKGVFVVATYNLKTFKDYVKDLKISDYQYLGKNLKNNVEMETYTKNKETIYLVTSINPDNGKKIYSLTFL